MGPLIADKDTQRTIIDRLDSLKQQIGVLLVDFADGEGWHNPVDGVEAQPDPAVAIQTWLRAFFERTLTENGRFWPRLTDVSPPIL